MKVLTAATDTFSPAEIQPRVMQRASIPCDFITRFESTFARVLILLMWSLACSISKKQAPGELGLVTRQVCRSETWWSWLHLL